MNVNDILSSLHDRALACFSVRFPLEFNLHTEIHAQLWETISSTIAVTRRSRHKYHGHQQNESDQVTSTHVNSLQLCSSCGRMTYRQYRLVKDGCEFRLYGNVGCVFGTTALPKFAYTGEAELQFQEAFKESPVG